MEAEMFDRVAFGRRMRSEGFWQDLVVDRFLLDAIARTPAKTALVAYRTDRPDPVRFTYAELGDLVSRAAGGLRRLGVGPGDVVSLQVPNWWEFAVVTLACGRLGAIVNPLMPIFRERELSFMLAFAASKVIVVPKAFRGFDHERMAIALQREIASLQHIVVVDGGENSFDALLLHDADKVEAAGKHSPVVLEPDDTSVLMFTSGTTGSPKGVMHTSNTLLACTQALSRRFALTADDVLLACSPLGHMTGFAATLLLGIRLGNTIVLQDTWEGRRGVAIMAAEHVTYTAASTPFLADICDTVAAGAERPAHLRSFLCGGAPIPPILILRADAELDLKVCSLWGMTEALSGTLTEPERAAVKSSKTDGRALEGMELRTVDAEGRPLPPRKTGRLMVRGAQMFSGYYKRPDLFTFDADGWFDTGDLAYTDEDGYIRVDGRTKDVLVRGGENVPVFEIESLLYKHPAVADAAIVGYPDDRLGERACAFVVLRPNSQLDLKIVQAYMTECKVAKQYWPERVEVVTELPRTATGKIKKFVLKETARAFEAPSKVA